jgi:transcriptional regulator NrdR family protein
MNCPRCNGKLRVQMTRNIDGVGGFTVRYRACDDCHLIVETYEEISREVKNSNQKMEKKDK